MAAQAAAAAVEELTVLLLVAVVTMVRHTLAAVHWLAPCHLPAAEEAAVVLAWQVAGHMTGQVGMQVAAWREGE
jgi:hypothetical protein